MAAGGRPGFSFSLAAACSLFSVPSRGTRFIYSRYRSSKILRDVVGYGIDCAEKYRNLPNLAALKRA